MDFSIACAVDEEVEFSMNGHVVSEEEYTKAWLETLYIEREELEKRLTRINESIKTWES